jgi:hypothetical protein
MSQNLGHLAHREIFLIIISIFRELVEKVTECHCRAPGIIFGLPGAYFYNGFK